jgi:hypothetical protein
MKRFWVRLCPCLSPLPVGYAKQGAIREHALNLTSSASSVLFLSPASVIVGPAKRIQILTCGVVAPTAAPIPIDPQTLLWLPKLV